MKEIVFVTSNKGKVASAHKYLEKHGISVISFDYDLEEPRSESLEEIAGSKVMQAYKLVGKPCIALDAGFFIESLGGWPSTFVNYNMSKLSLKGVLKLMEGVNNRECYFKECLAYYDGNEIAYFYGESRGSLSLEIRGIEDNSSKWSKLWHIFVPENHAKTLAEMSDYERNNRIDSHTSAFEEYAKYCSIENKVLKKSRN
jgi:XTP/dITP diphosphohydrolase